MKATCIILLFLGIFTQASFAQVGPGPKTTKASDLTMEFLTVKNQSRLGEIFHVISQLHGQRLVVVDESGASRSIQNIQEYGASFVVYDLPNNVERMKMTLARLDIPDTQGQKKKTTLITKEFKPRFITVIDAINALSPFRRSIQVRERNGPKESSRNLSVVENRGIVVMRDTPEYVQQMVDILTRIDLPKTQFLIACNLIQGVDGKGDEKLMKMLPQEIREVSPYSGFKSLGAGVVRASSGSLDRVQMAMTENEGFNAEISFRPSTFDPKTGVLGLEEIRVELQKTSRNGKGFGQSFSTTTTIKNNEFVVLGAFGDNPIFAVIHLISTK